MSEELDKNPGSEQVQELSSDQVREHLELLADSAKDLGMTSEQAKRVLSNSTQILTEARQLAANPDSSQKSLSRIAKIAAPLTLVFAAAFLSQADNPKSENQDSMPYPYAAGQIPPMSGAGAVAEGSQHQSQIGDAVSVTPEEYAAQFQRYTVQEGDNLATILNHIQPNKFTNQDGTFKTDTETLADLYDNVRIILQHNKSVLEKENDQLYQKMDSVVEAKGRKILPSELKQIVEETGRPNQIINIKEGQTLTIPKVESQ